MRYQTIIGLGIFWICSWVQFSLREHTFKNLTHEERAELQGLSKSITYRILMLSAIIFIPTITIGIFLDDSSNLSIKSFKTIGWGLAVVFILFFSLFYYKQLKQRNIPQVYINSWIKSIALTLLGFSILMILG